MPLTGPELLKEAEDKMKKSLEAVQANLSGLRTGRASAALVDNLKVDYYGQTMPLKQLAAIGTPDAKTIEIKPWDANAIQPIEKAISVSDLKLAPQRQGEVIRLNIPPMTQERRVEMVKLGKKLAEEGKVSVRNVRQDANNKLKDAKALSEDDRRKLTASVQKLTDATIAKIDEQLARKEQEITTI